MKKNNLVKEILKNSIMGFAIGVTLLMVSYICIYCILGENTFISEMGQLNNITILIRQIISTGVAYYCILASFNMITYLQDKKLRNKYITEHPYKSMLMLSLISLIFVVLIICLLSNPYIYSENISIVNISVLIIVYFFAGIIFGVKSFIESQIIKKINKELQKS